MITTDRLPASEHDEHDEPDVFDLERPRRGVPSRRRIAIVSAAAAIGLTAALALVLVGQPDAEGATTPPQPSFSLVDSESASRSTSERIAPAQSSGAEPVTAIPAAIDPTGGPTPPETRVAVPAGASRFVASAPARLLDTREGEPPPPDSEFTIAVPPSESIALSISVMDAERSGTVLVDGRRGVVEALRLPGAGATTTNLTIVPVDGDEITVRTSAGGHLVIDTVGTFESIDAPIATGRFIAADRYRIGRLVTADEGREIELPLTGQAWVDDGAYDTEGTQTAGPDYDLSDASAVLVLITADVAGEGGVVRIGPAHGDYQQMLMWGPASGEDRIRQGLAILTPTDGRLAALRYDGGSELTVEVAGYFTGEQASQSIAGVLLPTQPQTLVNTAIPAGSNRVVGGFDPGATGAIVTLNPTSGVPGRLGASVVATADGFGSIWTRDDVEVAVTLLAEFR